MHAVDSSNLVTSSIRRILTDTGSVYAVLIIVDDLRGGLGK